MKVVFSIKTNVDFKKHIEYLKSIRKSDGHKYQKYELDAISRSLKKNISTGLKNITTYIDSIFPDEYEFNHDDYKMYIDKNNHHIIFYTIEQDSSGRDFISVEKCIHSVELKRELKRRNIKPLKTADNSLLDDLNYVYAEDEVKLNSDSDEDYEQIIYTGPKSGRFYTDNWRNEIYPKEHKHIKSLKRLLFESNLIELKSIL